VILETLCADMGDLSSEAAQAAEAAKVDLAHAESLIDQELVPKQQDLKVDLSTVKH